MSDLPLGRYHFLSWARRGIGSSVNNPDGGALPSRASLSVQLSVAVQQGSSTNTVLPAVSREFLTRTMSGTGLSGVRLAVADGDFDYQFS